MPSLNDHLKATFPQRPVSKESAKALGEAVDRMVEWGRTRPPEPEAARVARERLDALTGMGGGPWANLYSSQDYAGSLRDRLEVERDHRSPTPERRTAIDAQIADLTAALDESWRVCEALGWKKPTEAEMYGEEAADG